MRVLRSGHMLPLLLFVCFAGTSTSFAGKLSLDAGWKLQSSCKLHPTGEQVSSLRYSTAGWIPALVPGTVLGSQVAAGIFPEPFFGMNLRKIPGTDYPIGKIFGYFPMSADSPYRCSWWYRKEFTARQAVGRSSSLHFEGINYRANVWVNGRKIASSDQLAGAFRSYDLDVSEVLAKDGRNVVAVEVFAQTENDLGIDFLDWNPAPADKDLGLWRGVWLETTGTVSISDPAVVTHFLNDDLSEAELHIVADVHNHSRHEVVARLTAVINGATLEQTATLAAQESRVAHFDPERYPALRVHHPAVWWPYQYGRPNLAHLKVTASVGSSLSDLRSTDFGIREVRSQLNRDGFLQFQVNRKNILIRGGGWAPDLFYREPRLRLEQELAYVKDMGLNAVRLEGKLGSDDLFTIADRLGILIIAGWQCCDYWQKWDKWTASDHEIANASLYSQISRLRSHPSLLVWLNGSDEAPSAQVETESLAILKEREWPNAVLSAAADRTSTISGRSGVKMSGPYDYVPPEYWYLDKDKVGGGFGFNTETGPGPAIPLASSIRRTLPRKSWWPIDQQWNYHAGLGKFAQYNTFNTAMSATYGSAADLDEYVRKAQVMAYDGERAMFEAYGANKYRSTGVVQWMLNNAWPSFIWHLYDYYMVAGGGYYGTRKANELLHIQYRYDDRKVIVVNSTLSSAEALTASASLFSLEGKQLFHRSASVQLDADRVSSAMEIPAQQGTVFLKLELKEADGKVLSENVYWLPAKLAELDWSKSTYVNTPALRYADMRDLSTLKETKVTAAARRVGQPGDAAIGLTNQGTSVAFFLHVRVVKAGTEEDLAPVFWDDNFISLMPGESRELQVRAIPAGSELKLDGWNIRSQTIAIPAPH